MKVHNKSKNDLMCCKHIDSLVIITSCSHCFLTACLRTSTRPDNTFMLSSWILRANSSRLSSAATWCTLYSSSQFIKSSFLAACFRFLGRQEGTPAASELLLDEHCDCGDTTSIVDYDVPSLVGVFVRSTNFFPLLQDIDFCCCCCCKPSADEIVHWGVTAGFLSKISFSSSLPAVFSIFLPLDLLWMYVPLLPHCRIFEVRAVKFQLHFTIQTDERQACAFVPTTFLWLEWRCGWYWSLLLLHNRSIFCGQQIVNFLCHHHLHHHQHLFFLTVLTTIWLDPLV